MICRPAVGRASGRASNRWTEPGLGSSGMPRMAGTLANDRLKLTRGEGDSHRWAAGGARGTLSRRAQLSRVFDRRVECATGVAPSRSLNA